MKNISDILDRFISKNGKVQTTAIAKALLDNKLLGHLKMGNAGVIYVYDDAHGYYVRLVTIFEVDFSSYLGNVTQA